MSNQTPCIAVQTAGAELCDDCELRLGYCPNLYSDVVTTGEITPEFLLAARATMYEIAQEEGIACSAYANTLMGWHFRYLGWYRHPSTHQRVTLDGQLLYYDKNYDGGKAELDIPSTKSLHCWYYHQYCRPYRGKGLPYVPTKYLKRHATAFSIVRAKFPEKCAHWPKA